MSTTDPKSGGTVTNSWSTVWGLNAQCSFTPMAQASSVYPPSFLRLMTVTRIASGERMAWETDLGIKIISVGVDDHVCAVSLLEVLPHGTNVFVEVTNFHPGVRVVLVLSNLRMNIHAWALNSIL